MKWLWELIRVLVEKVFNLSINDKLGGSIHFLFMTPSKFLYFYQY